MKAELTKELKADYKRELNHTTLILEAPEAYQESFKMRMLKENHIQGLLPVRGRGMDSVGIYEYDISGKVSLRSKCERGKITGKEINEFLVQIFHIISRVKSYLLDANGLILDPEYIFIEEGKYYFCYYPHGIKDIWIAFHLLTEYFVQQVDYQDTAGIKLAFLLHKETMEENYSLKKIIDKMHELDKEQLSEVRSESAIGRCKEEENAVYETTEHDWITKQEMGSKILKETDNLWTPVKRFLQKHKKPKWGDWDGIYIDEEEL